MAKKKTTKSEEYEYCRAIRDADGNLRWEYKIRGNPVPGRMGHSAPHRRTLARGHHPSHSRRPTA